MSSKLSNKNLTILFLVLLVITLIFFFSDAGKQEKTFRDKLVEIDTASVAEIKIYPKSENYNEVKLFKENDNWKVTLPGNRIFGSPKSKIQNLLSTLIGIKPERLAARGEDKWKEFEVTDSSGTRVVVIENGKPSLDIILGRFAFKQPRSMSTFVRLTNDTDVYEVEGFLAATFNQDADSFRDNTIIKSDFENWSTLVFNYPGDSSFALTKLNDIWFLNDEPTDSANTVKFFRSIQRLTSTNFVDDVENLVPVNPNYKLSIESADATRIEVDGFVRDSVYIIHSSLNPENYFDGNKVGLGNKIFTGRNTFFKNESK